ncbi:MAG: SAF domain-containing protein [Halanaerobium sp. T82-1]|nr:MAG: SAF domain-containing protein [Halanaerobium sp. T82-1]
MSNVYQDLRNLEAEGEFVSIGLVGAGQMGTDIVSQVAQMEGVRVPVVADIDLERAEKAYELSGTSVDDVVNSDDVEEIDKYIKDGKSVVTKDGFLLPKLDNVDVIIDATGVPKVGARLGLSTINHQKHIVMMNVEADVVVGPILKQMADNAGVVYTGAAGDEPGAIMEIYNFAKSMGYKVVAAGKGKNNPLDREANPEKVAERAERKGTAAHMMACFMDGTKSMLEMAAVSNATGLVPDVPGMHGPTTTVDELADVYSLKEQGGILNQEGIVDFALGDVAPGVFVVVTTDNDRVKFSMNYSKMGDGPNYLLYRPYHLASLETPLSAVRAVLYHEATIAPKGDLVTEVTTIAKKDLKPGDEIDNIGGFAVYGSVDKIEVAREKNLLPLGIAEGAKLKQEVKKGERLTLYGRVR